MVSIKAYIPDNSEKGYQTEIITAPTYGQADDIADAMGARQIKELEPYGHTFLKLQGEWVDISSV